MENVNLYDLFPTLCDLTNIPVPDGLDGRSLVPLMEGTGQWYNETISQYFFGQVMIKRDHLKYQYYGPDYTEVLFDLESDPLETINQINEKKGLQLKLNIFERGVVRWVMGHFIIR